ncbi:hypothetical protein M3Y97_00296400 [Aphelenchoides bicaudatus]|nr:hypothetical protein M3Y97_00296400 [Aphelenchoides bicaudatus]
MAGNLLLNNYELVLKSKYLGKIPVDVYRSQRTGLHVALAKSPGPVVNCHMVFATEADSDDGLPHTLEHLVFMGIKIIPIQRSTNAWTDQDHTSYTVKTIGATGMQKFVPIYMDHLINPLLTPENYRSEVYHVNKEGEEAGVVYSEIQNHENDLDNLVSIERKHLVFPQTPSYHCDTGGRMKEVRDLCSLQRVQAYHKNYYNFRNMWVLLAGNFSHEEMLKSVDELDSNPDNQPPSAAEFKRPFDLTIPDITHHRSKTSIVRGPSETGDEGVVQIGFLSRPAWDLEFMTAMKILSSYLTKTTSAPLMKEMVMSSEPFCDHVDISVEELPRCQVIADFTAVPVGKLEQVTDKFFDVIRSSTKPDALDMQRIKYLIELSIKKLNAKLEKGVSDAVFNNLIGYQLFSQRLDDQKHFDELMNPLLNYNKLKEKPAEYWSNLVAEIFTDNCVVVIGKPDANMGAEIAASEQKRLKELKEKAEAESAKRIKLDESPINDASSCTALNMFDSVGFDPNIETFKVETNVLPAFARQASQNGHPDLVANLPFTTVLHNMEGTSFYRAYMLFDLRNVPLELRKYLMIFDSLLGKSPAMVDGQLLSDTEHFYHFYVEAANGEFNLFPRWTKILLQDTVFEPIKVLAILKNLANGASTSKRQGNTMAAVVLKSLSAVKEHENRFYDDVVLEQFHRKLAKDLEGSRREEVANQIIEDLNKLRQHILEAPVNLHLVCNSKELGVKDEIPSNAWDFLNPGKKGDSSPVEKFTVSVEKDVRAFKQNRKNGASRVLKLEASDASFLCGETAVDVKLGSPEHVALSIMTQYFSVTEGILWKCIRGKGLAYGAWVSFGVESGVLEWDLYRCARPKLAYQTTKDAILELFEKKNVDPVLFDLAKRAAISGQLARYETLKGSGSLATIDSLRGKGTDHVIKHAKNVWKAEIDDVFELAKPYFIKLFDETQGSRAIVCPRNKLSEVKELFSNIETVTFSDLQYTPAE